MKKILTVSELASYLQVSTDSIYAMVREKQIPHIRVRRRILFNTELIEEWMRSKAQISI
ncbi:helix-turn-helix domain-containing protein [Paenibacillus urinalis]|uniref:Helix-turn-helix domain-containing protein n=1 Tax=Paenibacillus urinalis TaxID=521520 RepID=A0AAX3N0D6_9BACL|nr:helix-turn-helix domain-containing protein [Paenibacillus urinalis]WDH83301.1 helix-turn-helix domain-containing protein [Paenibacillus urinalis]